MEITKTHILLLLIGGALLLIAHSWLGILLFIAGLYLTNKRIDPPKEDIPDNITEWKKEQLKSINKKMEETKQKKEKEINEKLKSKKEELANIEDTLKQERANEEKKLNNQLHDKKEELKNINQKLEKMENEKKEELDKLEKQKEKQIEDKLRLKNEELNNIHSKLRKMEKDKQREIDKNLEDTLKEITKNKEQLKKLQKEISIMEDDIDFQSYGLYKPKYNFIDSISYKERLDAVRKEQKQMIKDKTAAIATKEWTVDGDKRKGKAFTNANIKQILRSFNNESEVNINKVKHSNIENIQKRIQKSYDQLNRLYERENVKITPHYRNLKLDELHIAYEYEVKKQEEKELLREAREREREEKKLQKELEREKKKFNTENNKLEEEIKKAKAEMSKAADAEKQKLEAEIQKLKEALNKNNEEITKIDTWKEKPGAGYVYIISNIGSFGEGVFKIGVTRRDNPEERIRELSSASVPFKYDTHAFIFSKDAYELEKNLHDRFDKQRMNKVNKRKEFFKISIDDVKQVVEENKASVHSFVEHPDAEEYYDTLKIEEKLE